MVHTDAKILDIIAKLSPALASTTYYVKDLVFWLLLPPPCPMFKLSNERVFYIFKGDSPSRSCLGSQKYLHNVDKNTSTMVPKIPPQCWQKYLHNGDKNTSTIKEEPKKMMEHKQAVTHSRKKLLLQKLFLFIWIL